MPLQKSAIAAEAAVESSTPSAYRSPHIGCFGAAGTWGSCFCPGLRRILAVRRPDRLPHRPEHLDDTEAAMPHPAMTSIRTICVYCGSGPGTDPAFVEAARHFGRILAESGVSLVYGG